MLQNTFIHIPGISYLTERKIWDSGIKTWTHFFSQSQTLKLPTKLKDKIFHFLTESQHQLANKNHRFFSQFLPKREYWRLYPDFKDQIAFLDIETTGLNFLTGAYNTMIGLYDGAYSRTFIRGFNLQEFQQQIKSYPVIVTFYGTRFDLPFIQHTFPKLKIDQIHIDLCYLLRRLGLSGGLKAIEQKLGIQRTQETQQLTGSDAVQLWQEYQKGSQKALQLLIQYNTEDVVNLESLLKFAYQKLSQAQEVYLCKK